MRRERPQVRLHERLDDHLPVDHRLGRVYRVGAGLMGLVLLAFGILGLLNQVPFLDTEGDRVAGLSTNGALSVLSIVVGLLLFVGMLVGGTFASNLNMLLGVAFLLSGFANLALLDTGFNFLAFQMSNVLFSFAVGLLLMVFGMYGRVSGGLPHDNPYWRQRHPELVAYEATARARLAARRTEPPRTEPPRTEPPRTEPPGVEPPGVEPPGVEPPGVEPPGVEPPPARPPRGLPRG